jgi:hypothetical protein
LRAVRVSEGLDRIAPISVVLVILAHLLWLAWPSLLPIGGTPELAAHLALIDRTEQQFALPTTADLGRLEGIAQHPPGFHWIVAMVGRSTGVPGQRAVYPILAVLVALKAGLLFVIARRLLRPTTPRTPFALMAVALALLPQAYFFGAFVQQSFYSQVAAELLVLAGWWRLVAWDDKPTLGVSLQVGVLAAAALITWPLFWGPMAIVGFAVVITHRPLTWSDRLMFVVALIAPTVLLAMIRAYAGWTWALVWDASQFGPGAPLRELGIALLMLGTIGLAVDARRETRTLLLLTGAIALQTIFLLTVARSAGFTPNPAFRMFYLLIYPLAVAGALAIAAIFDTLATRNPAPTGRRWSPLSWGLAAAMMLLALGRAVPVSPHAVTEPLYLAGMWARERLPATCVDYVVANPDTAHWLHVAVLGNPPSSRQLLQSFPLPMQQALARWMRPDAAPYAIIDLAMLPEAARDDVTILVQFGNAAVVERLGGGVCGSVA